MIIFNTIYKKIIGRKQVDTFKSMLVAIILYISLSNLDFIMYEDANVLYYVAFIFCSGLVFKLMNEHEDILKLSEVFILPYKNMNFNYSYALVLTLYAIISKFTPLISILFAFGRVSIIDGLLTFVFAINGAITSFLCKDYLRKKNFVLAIIIIVINLANVLIWNNVYFVILLMLAMLLLTAFVDPYSYYNGNKQAKSKNYIVYKNSKFTILRYFVRYMLEHKVYLINTFALYIFALILPLLLTNMFPVCLAIVSINTPIGILVSSERGLGVLLEILPNQNKKFYTPYFLVTLGSNIIANTISLVSLSITTNTFEVRNVILAILFALISGAIAIILEHKFRIEKWNVESDLWHNPRKYITFAILFTIASIIVIAS